MSWTVGSPSEQTANEPLLQPGAPVTSEGWTGGQDGRLAELKGTNRSQNKTAMTRTSLDELISPRIHNNDTSGSNSNHQSHATGDDLSILPGALSEEQPQPHQPSPSPTPPQHISAHSSAVDSTGLTHKPLVGNTVARVANANENQSDDRLDSNDSKDSKDNRDNRDNKDNKDTKDHKDNTDDCSISSTSAFTHVDEARDGKTDTSPATGNTDGKVETDEQITDEALSADVKDMYKEIRQGNANVVDKMLNEKVQAEDEFLKKLIRGKDKSTGKGRKNRRKRQQSAADLEEEEQKKGLRIESESMMKEANRQFEAQLKKQQEANKAQEDDFLAKLAKGKDKTKGRRNRRRRLPNDNDNGNKDSEEVRVGEKEKKDLMKCSQTQGISDDTLEQMKSVLAKTQSPTLAGLSEEQGPEGAHIDLMTRLEELNEREAAQELHRKMAASQQESVFLQKLLLGKGRRLTKKDEEEVLKKKQLIDSNMHVFNGLYQSLMDGADETQKKMEEEKKAAELEMQQRMFNRKKNLEAKSSSANRKVIRILRVFLSYKNHMSDDTAEMMRELMDERIQQLHVQFKKEWWRIIGEDSSHFIDREIMNALTDKVELKAAQEIINRLSAAKNEAEVTRKVIEEESAMVEDDGERLKLCMRRVMQIIKSIELSNLLMVLVGNPLQDRESMLSNQQDAQDTFLAQLMKQQEEMEEERNQAVEIAEELFNGSRLNQSTVDHLGDILSKAKAKIHDAVGGEAAIDERDRLDQDLADKLKSLSEQQASVVLAQQKAASEAEARFIKKMLMGKRLTKKQKEELEQRQRVVEANAGVFEDMLSELEKNQERSKTMLRQSEDAAQDDMLRRIGEKKKAKAELARLTLLQQNKYKAKAEKAANAFSDAVRFSKEGRIPVALFERMTEVFHAQRLQLSDDEKPFLDGEVVPQMRRTNEHAASQLLVKNITACDAEADFLQKMQDSPTKRLTNEQTLELLTKQIIIDHNLGLYNALLHVLLVHVAENNTDLSQKGKASLQEMFRKIKDRSAKLEKREKRRRRKLQLLSEKEGLALFLHASLPAPMATLKRMECIAVTALDDQIRRGVHAQRRLDAGEVMMQVCGRRSLVVNTSDEYGGNEREQNNIFISSASPDGNGTGSSWGSGRNRIGSATSKATGGVEMGVGSIGELEAAETLAKKMMSVEAEESILGLALQSKELEVKERTSLLTWKSVLNENAAVMCDMLITLIERPLCLARNEMDSRQKQVQEMYLCKLAVRRRALLQVSDECTYEARDAKDRLHRRALFKRGDRATGKQKAFPSISSSQSENTIRFDVLQRVRALVEKEGRRIRNDARAFTVHSKGKRSLGNNDNENDDDDDDGEKMYTATASIGNTNTKDSDKEDRLSHTQIDEMLFSVNLVREIEAQSDEHKAGEHLCSLLKKAEQESDFIRKLLLGKRNNLRPPQRRLLRHRQYLVDCNAGALHAVFSVLVRDCVRSGDVYTSMSPRQVSAYDYLMDSTATRKKELAYKKEINHQLGIMLVQGPPEMIELQVLDRLLADGRARKRMDEILRELQTRLEMDALFDTLISHDYVHNVNTTHAHEYNVGDSKDSNANQGNSAAGVMGLNEILPLSVVLQAHAMVHGCQDSTSLSAVSAQRILADIGPCNRLNFLPIMQAMTLARKRDEVHTYIRLL